MNATFGIRPQSLFQLLNWCGLPILVRYYEAISHTVI